jgi:hypothetical protein
MMVIFRKGQWQGNAFTITYIVKDVHKNKGHPITGYEGSGGD